MRNKELMGDSYIGQRQIQQIRDKEIVSIACLDKLCRLLDCKIEDIIEYIKD
jgi:DNA-binding Xre family transcriptional regulator